MAQKQAPKNNKRRIPKPERILRAQPKKVIVKPPKEKTPPKRRKPAKIPLRRFANKRVKKSLFYPIVACVLALVTIITFMQVKESVHSSNQLYKAAAERANDSFLFAKKEADLVRIIGTKLERRSEIINYQSAPADLRTFVEADYRKFKESCIIDKKISGQVRYEIENVSYDSFARIKRTCNNGTDTVLLKKFDTWAVIFSGNILPPCSLTNDLDVPQGASYYCAYDGVQYLNPNP